MWPAAKQTLHSEDKQENIQCPSEHLVVAWPGNEDTVIRSGNELGDNVPVPRLSCFYNMTELLSTAGWYKTRYPR